MESAYQTDKGGVVRTAHLSLGSNIGDSRAIIARAVADIVSIREVIRLEQSPPYESEPWGFESPNRFVNVGVKISTTLGPLELLERLQDIERRHWNHSHRNADGSYRDRALDIDIITMSGVEMHTPQLTLPHPRMSERPFVTVPMAMLNRIWPD